MSRGVIYYAVGERHRSEMKNSIASLREVMPDLPVTVFSDAEPSNLEVDRFVRINSHSEPLIEYISYLRDAPYDRILFLDTDTHICTDLSELFELLDNFDIAVAHDSVRVKDNYEPGIPESFPTFNTGVILYRNSTKCMDLITEWESLYRDYAEQISERLYSPDGSSYANDQPFFREALYESNARFNVLPPEYNCRFAYPGYVQQDVKIVHAHDIDPQKAAKAINKHAGMRRVHTGSWLGKIYFVRKNYNRPVEVAEYPGPNRYIKLLSRFFEVIQKNDIKTVTRKMTRWASRNFN
jgi:hypothetical protein